MTISSRVHSELFAVKELTIATSAQAASPMIVKLIRIPLNNPRVDPHSKEFVKNQRRRERRQRGRNPTKHQLEPKGLAWTAEEHDRFLRGLEVYQRGPWKEIAKFVGTRSVRQTMTHAQKYRQKIARHQRGLLPSSPSKSQAEVPNTQTSRTGTKTRRRRLTLTATNVTLGADDAEEAPDFLLSNLPIAHDLDMNPTPTPFELANADAANTRFQDTGFEASGNNRNTAASVIADDFQVSLLLDARSINEGLTAASDDFDPMFDEDLLDDLMDESLIQHVVDQYLDSNAFNCVPAASHHSFGGRHLLGAERC